MRAVAAALDSPLPPIIDREVVSALAPAPKAAVPAAVEIAAAPAKESGLAIVMDDTPIPSAHVPQATAGH